MAKGSPRSAAWERMFSRYAYASPMNSAAMIPRTVVTTLSKIFVRTVIQIPRCVVYDPPCKNLIGTIGMVDSVHWLRDVPKLPTAPIRSSRKDRKNGCAFGPGPDRRGPADRPANGHFEPLRTCGQARVALLGRRGLQPEPEFCLMECEPRPGSPPISLSARPRLMESVSIRFRCGPSEIPRQRLNASLSPGAGRERVASVTEIGRARALQCTTTARARPKPLSPAEGWTLRE